MPEPAERTVSTRVQLALEGEILPSLSHRSREELRGASTGRQPITALVSLRRLTSKIPEVLLDDV